MKWPLFENKIKSELSSHRSEVDIDALWGAIEPEVDAINASKRKKRFGAIWFLLAGILLLGSGAGFYFLNNNGVSNDAAISSDLLNKERNNNEKNGLTEKSTSNTGSTSNLLNENDTNTDKIFENKNETELIHETQPRNNSNKNTINSSQENIEKENDKNPIISNPPIAVNKDFTTKNTIEKNTQSTSSVKDINPKKSNTLLDSPNGSNKILASDATEKTRSSNPIERISTSDIPLFETTVNAPRIRISAMKSTLAGDPRPPTTPDEQRHPMSKKIIHFSIAANGGISYANRNLSAKDSSGNDLIKLRERTEKQLETSHLGLQLNMRHKSGFDISTGLQYTRIVERFEYHDNITTTDSIQGILYYAVNPNNDTIAIPGIVPHTTHIAINKKYYNRYAMFDIPVIVGYFNENDNLTYGAQAGVFANISLKTEGHFLKNEKEDEDIKDLFKSSVGMSYFVGLYGGYKIGDQIEIGASPYMRYFPKNFAINGYPISQKYTLFGLDVKLRYWF